MDDYADRTIDCQYLFMQPLYEDNLLEIYHQYKHELKDRGYKNVGLDEFDFIYRSAMLSGMRLEHERLLGINCETQPTAPDIGGDGSALR